MTTDRKFRVRGLILAAAFSVAVGTLSAPVIALADDGYTNTVKALQVIQQGAVKRGKYVENFCRLPGDPNSSFTQRSQAQMSKHFNERNLGSQMNCVNYSGAWVDGPATFFINEKRVFKMTYVGDRGLNYEYDFPAQGTSIMIVRIADSQGSNIVISANLTDPAKSQFVEARLPISMQSNGIVAGKEKAYSYSSDELVEMMNNQFRHNIRRMPNATLFAYANQLLLSRQERELLLKASRKALGAKKKQAGAARGTAGTVAEPEPDFGPVGSDGKEPGNVPVTK